MPGIVKALLATAFVLFVIFLASLVKPVVVFVIGLPFEAKLWLMFFILIGVYVFGVCKMAPALDEE